MAIQDFAPNMYGDVLKDNATILKGIATVQAQQAALNMTRANLVDSNQFLQTTVGALNQLPSFSPSPALGGGAGLGGGMSGAASPLIPVQ